MSRIVKIAKVLRNNWKKSTVGFVLLAYGGSYGFERYRMNVMMRGYCLEAKKYGEKTLPELGKPKHVTVILNPEANDKKSHAQYEKFAAPLLHLAGLKVSVVQTEKQRQALDLMRIMSNTDAVIVAGGDGTLHEAVTGFLRRPGAEDEMLPVGIVPLGKTNTVAQHLFGSKASSRPQLMAEAVMAIIREKTVKLDCLRVQFSDDDMPVYGMCDFEEGSFAEVEPLVQKYWYFGALKEMFTYFKNSFKAWPLLENAELSYVAPCAGCSNCYKDRSKSKTESRRWWSMFVPKSTSTPVAVDPALTTVNDDCGKKIALSPTYGNITVSTSAAFPNEQGKPNTLWIKRFPGNLSWREFLHSGLDHRKSKVRDSTGLSNIVEARELIINTTLSTPFENESPIGDDEVISESSNVTKSTEIEISPNSVDTLSEESNNAETTTSEKEATSNSMAEADKESEDKGSEDKESEDKGSEDVESKDKEIKDEMFSYIDKEKYKRTSCNISLLPKHVTIFA